MSRRVSVGQERRRGSRRRNVNRHHRDRRRRMLARFRGHNLIVPGDGILATCVGVRRRSASPLQAAIRHLAGRSAGREAIEGPEKQNYRHQTDRDVKGTSHSAQASTLSPRRRSRSEPNLWPHFYFSRPRFFAGGRAGFRSFRPCVLLLEKS
jgi:hypothetical protein